MTRYVDLEYDVEAPLDNTSFDILIVGGGAAGLTVVRGLAGLGLVIGVLESGALEETPEHEALNSVEVSETSHETRLQGARQTAHAYQMKFWSAQNQKFGVRCRVLGGSTAAWAGKVAPFDAIDFSERSWISNSGWPIDDAALAPYIRRAAELLDLGPLINDRQFWAASKVKEPAEFSKSKYVESFFWQFARSRQNMTDVMRFGPDFRSLDIEGVTVLLNATVCSVNTDADGVTGVEVVSTLSAKRRFVIKATTVVLAAGAIENARLLLISKNKTGHALGNSHDTVGRYLMDHPSMAIGAFSTESQERAAGILGFFALQQNYRVYMYSHGLCLRPEIQRKERLPNMAVYTNIHFSDDDPLLSFRRLVTGQSKQHIADFVRVLKSWRLVISYTGRKVLGSPKLPTRVRRFIVDATVKLSPNFAARDYAAKGTGRKIKKITLNVICEQPPSPENRVILSDQRDRLGLPIAHVIFDAGESLRRDVLTFARLLDEDLRAAGIEGFCVAPEIVAGNTSAIDLYDMAHTAGTTRMGREPVTSVVNERCQVHGISGLYIAGASVFPTVGHANPTMVIVAMAIRLADHLKSRMMAQRLSELADPAMRQPVQEKAESPLVLVTGGTGNLGTAVIENLLKGGFRVRGHFHRKIPSDPRVQWVNADFADDNLADEVLDKLVEGVTAVIHLAASLPGMPHMLTTNVTNLERLAAACVRNGVKYFGQASSMVVYGSPCRRLVAESTPLIDVNLPLQKQYFAARAMREYARSKRLGEEILGNYSNRMHVDLYRIALAQKSGYLEQSLNWSRKKRFFVLYRNSHFISTGNVARAITHLLRVSAKNDYQTGAEAFNVADTNSPTYSEFYRHAGLNPGIHLPLLFDVLKDFAVGRSFFTRYPMGFFRLDNSKLRSTGFDIRADN
ncbi:GMC oxidoreductase [Paraburkholderia sp. RL17-337-BIB-A]|uniref:GMC oxidoreductase n=1 Tax=Paraburkholderia sp. RL17-337-BIB-A TaxID=3031636 RepID=UPI0038BCFDC2